MFSKRKLSDNMSKVFVKNGHTVLRKLAEYAKQPQVSFDLQDVFFRYTLDSICEIGFGVELGSLSRDVPFQKAFDRAQATSERRYYKALWKLERMLNLPVEAQLKRDVRVLNSFAYDTIKERRKSKKNLGVDILSTFVKMKDPDGKPFSDKYLRDIIMNFVIAGECEYPFPMCIQWCLLSVTESE